MADKNEVMVEYRRESPDIHSLVMSSKALPDIRIDYTGIPQDQRGGTSLKLLAGSILYCFAATLNSALTARGAKVWSLRGCAKAVKGKDEILRTKVKEVAIDIEVALDDKDEPILERCKAIMERGCLVSYSLEESFEVEYHIKRLRPEEVRNLDSESELCQSE